VKSYEADTLIINYSTQTMFRKTPAFHRRLSGFLQEHFLYNETGKYGFNNFPLNVLFFSPS